MDVLELVEKAKTALESKESSRIKDALQAAYIPLANYEQPPVILTFGGQPVLLAKGITTVTGKAKSRKSSLTAIMCAAITKPTFYAEKKGIEGLKQKDGRCTVLYFDTEQSKFYANRINRTVHKLGDIDNFKLFGLRQYDTEMRREIIEAAINAYPDTFAIVIDGTRDLVNSINDESEATKIATWLMRIAETKNIGIINLVHQNKGKEDSTVRGHLGTELVNKSESIIEVKKDDDNKDVSLVSPLESRDKDFESFYIGYIDGLPALTDGPVKQSKKSLLQSIKEDDSERKKVARELQTIWSGTLNSTDAKAAVGAATGLKTTDAATALTYLKANGYILETPQSTGAKREYMLACFQD